MSSDTETVLRLTQAFTDQDRRTITELVAEDCVWRVPGRNSLSGDYQGRAEILGLFGRIKRQISGSVRFDVIDVATSDERVMVYQHAVVDVGGGQIFRLKECLVYTVREGKIVELDEFQSDVHAFDELFPLR